MSSRTTPPPVRLAGDWAAGVKGGLRARVSDLERDALDRTNRRLRFAAFGFAMCFALLGLRLADLTLSAPYAIRPAAASEKPDGQMRPRILDRNGVVLATQIETTTLGADARLVDEPSDITARLTQIIPDLNRARTTRLLAGKSRYVVLHKGLSPEQHQAILHIGNPALKLRPATKRVYPSGAVAAHVLGYVGNAMRGLAGLERWLDKQDRDHDLNITLDVRIQHIARDALQNALARFDARFGAAAVVDIHNGDVLALVSLPDFDPNRPGNPTERGHFNHMTLGVYELGSIFKLFTAAMVLEGGYAKSHTRVNVTDALVIGQYRFADKKARAPSLSVHDVVVHSSNTGSARLALSVPATVHRDFLNALGLMDAPQFELLEVGAPLTPSRWGEIERATVSFGHGLAVSPLKALMAVAALVNGGVVYPPRLVADDAPIGARIISPQASHEMRKMMRAVVTHGTGRQAEVAGYGVMGKTGSADKSVAGGYDTTRLLTSFVGAFPLNAPRYAVLVMLDEPQGIDATHGLATAGWNAAPTAAQIIARTAPLLGLVPQADDRLAALIETLPAQEVSYAP